MRNVLANAKTDLVNEVLTMIVTQILCPDNAVQIGLHQFLDEIDLPELSKAERPKYI